MLVVRRIDGVVMLLLKNDNTDPEGPDDPDGLDLPGGNAAAAAVDCAAVTAAAVESKGGTVSELARPQNASNPGKGGRLVARAVGSPVAPKYGAIGRAVAASAAAAAASSSSSSLLSSSSSSLIDPAAFLTAIASANFFEILPPDAAAALPSQKTDVGALSVSDQHAMSARNWRHMQLFFNAPPPLKSPNNY